MPGCPGGSGGTALPMDGQARIGDVFGWRASIPPPLPTDYHYAAVPAGREPGYFATMGIPLQRGRASPRPTGGRTGRDRRVTTRSAGCRRPATRSDAGSCWAEVPTDSVWRKIVGVVGDVRHRGLTSRRGPRCYSRLRSSPVGHRFTHRSRSRVWSGPRATRRRWPRRSARRCRALDPDVPLSSVRPMASWRSDAGPPAG